MKYNPPPIKSKPRLGSLLLSLIAISAPLHVSAQWESKPMTTEAQYLAGSTLGEGVQFPYSMIRSVSNPDRLYWSHDVGQIWRSDDNGQSWVHPPSTGLYVNGGESVQCDPVNSDVVFVLAANNWDFQRVGQQGIYRSTDAGDSWVRVQAIDLVQHQNSVSNQGARYEQLRFVWDPTTVSLPIGQRVWYCAVNREDDTTQYNPRIYKSTDGGVTWSMINELTYSTFKHIDMLVHHPTQSGKLFLATETGLFKSIDSGLTFPALAGNRPAGRVRSIDINPADATDIYATVDNLGLYRTTNAGTNWDLIKSYEARRVVVDPSDRDHIYLMGRQKKSGVTGGPLIVTSNADQGVNATWTKAAVERVDGTMNNDPDGGWETSIAGEMANLVPDPRNGNIASAHAFAQIYRTTDGGATFVRATTGFTGQSARDIWFDATDGARFATFNVDVGMKLTETGANWFESRGASAIVSKAVPLPADRIRHGTMFSGDFKPGTNSQIVVASAGHGGTRKLIRSTNEGVTWTVIDTDKARNINLVRFSPTNGNIVYADNRRFDNAAASLTFTALSYHVVGVYNGNGDTVFGIDPTNDTVILKSTAKGANGTWTTFATGANVRPFDTTPVFAIHPTNANIIYTCRANGDLSKFDAGAGTWTDYNVLPLTELPGGPSLANNISGIAISPSDPNVIIVSTRGTGQPFFFQTVDGGTNWTDISYNLARNGSGAMGLNPVTGDLYTCVSALGFYKLSANSVPNITTTSLPGTIAGEAYSQTLTATGGDGTLVWSLDTGTLPAGLSLSTGGVISGSATGSGTSNFTVRVADGDAFTGSSDEDTQALSIVVTANSVPAIITASLPGGTVGTAYSQSLASTGGNGTPVWSLASGSLPAGLSLSSGGVISGTPSTAATSNFTVRLADSDGVTGSGDEDTQALSIVVSSAAVGIFSNNEDIGSPGIAGSASLSSGTYTVSGGGSDIYNSADQFQFVHEGWTGNGRLIARVISQTTPITHNWAKAGVMFRDSTATGARNVDLIIAPNPVANGSVQMLERATTNATTTEVARVNDKIMPYWLRLERYNNLFTGWHSLDGLTWFVTGSTTLALNSPARAGLVVTAHDDTKLNTATFDNVSLVAAPTWTAQDIGTVNAAGSTTVDRATDVITLNGGGLNVYGTADSFHFYGMPWSAGDVTIVAEVTAVENTHTNAKAGLMIRQSLDADSAQATIAMTPTKVEFLRRTTTGGSTTHTNTTQALPRFLKLVRSGNSFSAYHSDDSLTWTQLGTTQTISMANDVYVGLANCSLIDTSNLCTATFESVFVK